MNRKDFISLSGLGFLGLYACGTSKLMNHKKPLAIQLYTVRDAIAENLEKSLESLSELGFNQLEIYGYDGKFYGKTKTEFQTILKNIGLEVISSHHTTGIVHNSKGTLLNNWEQSVEDLHFIGAKYMVCSYLFEEERTLEHYRKLPELLNQSGEITKKAGIHFAYHNHDFEFEKFEDKTVYDFILENTDSDMVKMELDLYWISKAGFNPLDYFEKHPNRFPLWHVKDMKAGNKDFAEIGNGTIDFKTIFEAREKAGLKHWFVEQDSSDKDMFESLKISTDYIAKNNFFQ